MPSDAEREQMRARAARCRAQAVELRELAGTFSNEYFRDRLFEIADDLDEHARRLERAAAT